MNCFLCNQSIEHQQVVVIENKTKFIHQECFRCSLCRCQLEGYLLKNGVLYCVDCLQTKMMNEKCEKCNENIQGKKIKVGTKYYHPHCFSCTICHHPIETNYYEKDSLYICMSCYKQQKHRSLK